LNTNLLTLIRILIPLSGLAYASYKDWIEREVDDWIWIFSGAAGGSLTLVDLIYGWDINLGLTLLISMALSIGLALAFYFLGFYGGADAKGIMVISLSLPIYYPPIKLHPFTGLASLSNGLLISLILLPAFFILNLIALARGEKIFDGFEHERTLRKIVAMFFGVRVKNATRRKFWFPLETEREGKRFFDFKLLGLEFEEAKRDDCWMTPGLPLLISITIGFLFYVLVGDMLAVIIKLFTTT